MEEVPPNQERFYDKQWNTCEQKRKKETKKNLSSFLLGEIKKTPDGREVIELQPRECDECGESLLHKTKNNEKMIYASETRKHSRWKECSIITFEGTE